MSETKLYIERLKAETKLYIERLKAELERRQDDNSPGDVIAAYEDGTIVLDDGVTTWNPARAMKFKIAEAVKVERETCATLVLALGAIAEAVEELQTKLQRAREALEKIQTQSLDFSGGYHIWETAEDALREIGGKP